MRDFSLPIESPSFAQIKIGLIFEKKRQGHQYNETQQLTVSPKSEDYFAIAKKQSTYSEGVQMGMIRMGPPEDLVIQISQSFQVNYFIETGTYYGNTAVWAAQYFSSVFTIEYSQSLYEQAVFRHCEIKNIEFRFGDSRTQLEQIVSTLNESAIFWLDAHWSDSFTYGENDQCPLLDEIQVINQSPHEHFLFIDDARLFTSPPQPPHNPEQWPDLTMVVNALSRNHDDSRRYIVIIEDVIIAVPITAKPLLVNYCQSANARIWANFLEQSAISDFDKAMQLLNQGNGTGSTSVSFRILKHLYSRFRKSRKSDTRID